MYLFSLSCRKGHGTASYNHEFQFCLKHLHHIHFFLHLGKAVCLYFSKTGTIVNWEKEDIVKKAEMLNAFTWSYRCEEFWDPESAILSHTLSKYLIVFSNLGWLIFKICFYALLICKVNKLMVNWTRVSAFIPWFCLQSLTTS